MQFPGQAGALVTAASAVRGSYQISPGVLSKGGVAVKMKSVGHLKKTLYISPACKAEHADFFNLLQRVVARAGCTWAMMFENWPAVKAAEKGCNVVAIVQPEERDGAQFRDHKRTFTLADFVQSIAQPDSEKSLTGLAEKHQSSIPLPS